MNPATVQLESVLWSSNHGLVALANAADAEGAKASEAARGASEADSAAAAVCGFEDVLRPDLSVPDLAGAAVSKGNFVLKLQRRNASESGMHVVGDENVHQAENEIDIMRHLDAEPSKCKFIVEFLFGTCTPQVSYIGMEHCRGGDLFSLLASCDSLLIGDVIHYAVEIAIGIQYLHDRNIIHADLKPENIGLTASGHVRLLDFGLSVLLDEERDRNPENGRLEVVTSSGTIFYSAPEILRRECHGIETDWWSYGVLIFEMLFGSWPWDGVDAQETCNLICCTPLPSPQDLGAEALDADWDLIEKLLVKPRSERLGYNKGLEDIKTHALFASVDWDLAAREGYLAPFSLQ
ncbi:Protein kinase, putative [Hondaea fermentalgiana]|uniref:Protein kinase, putative n=1 Tax=Hondaea fermentalgiana TaxID=2315210 RepID=A0A2R5GGI9_9STRA|nr:Protein kinase, putative [Hondaea fermentalgiana]|eukprot:GBG30012.1 Protein kinase, putative [Hondaea fermentalgiana]